MIVHHLLDGGKATWWGPSSQVMILRWCRVRSGGGRRRRYRPRRLDQRPVTPRHQRPASCRWWIPGIGRERPVTKDCS